VAGFVRGATRTAVEIPTDVGEHHVVMVGGHPPGVHNPAREVRHVLRT
jgi:hypothetical protein